MHDDEAFDDPVAEGRHYRLLCKDLQDELADVKLALEDFQTSSKDLEEELERELAATEKRESELRAEAERLRADNDQWKTRHQAALKEHTTTLAHMQKELDGLRTSEKQLRTKLRDMELDNDDLEKNERAISSTLSDMEARYNRAIERTALLEHELVDKARLEEELQRLKDELRDTCEELVVLRTAAPPRNGYAQTPWPSEAEGPVTPDNNNTQKSSDDRRLRGDTIDQFVPESLLSAPSPDNDLPAHEPGSAEQHRVRDRPISYNTRSSAVTMLSSSSLSLERLAAIRESPSKLPRSSSPIKLDFSPTCEIPSASDAPSSSLAFLPNTAGNISRSTNNHNLSSLAASRKSLTPQSVRQKRTEGMVGEMQSVTSRLQKLTAQLNTRRESLVPAGVSTGIPRRTAGQVTQIPRSSSSSISLASVSRSASVRRNNAASPTDVVTSLASSTLQRAPREPSSKGQAVSTTRPPASNSVQIGDQPSRPESRLGKQRSAALTATSARYERPSSRLSTISAGRQQLDGPADAGRSPTPSSSQHRTTTTKPALEVGRPSGSIRSTRAGGIRRDSIGPGASRGTPGARDSVRLDSTAQPQWR